MSTPRARAIARVALSLSLLTFCIFFLNVLIGGPLGKKPWLNDLHEMLVLFVSVILFVAGTLACEARAQLNQGSRDANSRAPDDNGI